MRPEFISLCLPGLVGVLLAHVAKTVSITGTNGCVQGICAPLYLCSSHGDHCPFRNVLLNSLRLSELPISRDCASNVNLNSKVWNYQGIINLNSKVLN